MNDAETHALWTALTELEDRLKLLEDRHELMRGTIRALLKVKA